MRNLDRKRSRKEIKSYSIYMCSHCNGMMYVNFDANVCGRQIHFCSFFAGCRMIKRALDSIIVLLLSRDSKEILTRQL